MNMFNGASASTGICAWIIVETSYVLLNKEEKDYGICLRLMVFFVSPYMISHFQIMFI